ncbi:MAG: DUF5777 family beta-barrel protein [Vicinamibacterales bacterium]
MKLISLLAVIVLSASLTPAPALASDQSAATKASGAASAPASNAPPSTAASAQDDPDRDPNFAQPDFNLASLPTSLRVPKYKSAFRVTHRFGRPLGDGDFGNLLEDLFGFDSGAQIGLEYRFGVVPGGQVGIHRTSNRTIEFFGQYDVLLQRNGAPVGVTALATIEGTNNFRDSYSPAFGAIVSRELGQNGALYVEPIWVNNTNELPSELADDNDTFMIGLGGRARVRPTVYVFFEVTPRVAGYDPGVNQVSFGIEKRAGGHLFQLNFSNGIGTTLAQIARGGGNNDDWYIGFNISRKFF